MSPPITTCPRSAAAAALALSVALIPGCSRTAPSDAGTTPSANATSRASPVTRDHAAVEHLYQPAHEDCPLCALYESRSRSVVRVRNQTGQGAGLVLSANGLVITNAHVVADAQEVLVETSGGAFATGRVLRRDGDADLALVLVASPDVMWQPVDWMIAEPPRIGSTIYAIGHPLGLGWTITRGVISGVRKPGEVAKVELLQTDAAISPGNSGGPVFDEHGHPVAIVRSKANAPGAENIAFVIPWSVVRAFLDAEPLP